MAIYWKDANGVVHVADQSGQGEFTHCGFSHEGDDNISDHVGEGEMVIVKGPSDCELCKKAIDGFRDSIKGVRFDL